MIKNHKLLIDQDCPMCNIYGKCFVGLKWIDKQSLSPYQLVSTEHAHKIDMHKARNEIAFFDEISERTHYGLQAFIKILSINNRLFNWILQFAPIQFLLNKLYKLISYNRKVIYPVAQIADKPSCTPDFNLTYRWLYILGVAICTGLILNQFIYPINQYFGSTHLWWREYIICFGQVIWQLIASYFITKNRSIEYLGNMSTVSLIGGILIIPLLIVLQFFNFSAPVMLLYFSGVVGLMLLEHIRRCRLLNLSLGLTFSWILYRMLVLAIIVFSIIKI